MSIKADATRAVLVALCTLVAAALAPPAHAIMDTKTINPVQCQALGPGTTPAELSLTVSGLTNPGDVSETVMCPLGTDGEQQWENSWGKSASLRVHFKAGAVAGKVQCTAFVGSGAVNVGPVASVSVNPANATAGTRGFFEMALLQSSPAHAFAPQLTLVCTISPKATLGSIVLYESAPTNVP
jgi:hypothetical protein